MSDPDRTEEWTSPHDVMPPKKRFFLITTAGPGMDLCSWNSKTGRYEDYYHKQHIAPKWPYMVAWCDVREPADVMAFAKGPHYSPEDKR